MIEIHVGNSVCQISGITASQLTRLRQVCSYTVSTGRKRPIRTKSGKLTWLPDIQKRHLMSEKGVFPTGLLYRVEHFLRQKGWTFQLRDNRVKPKLNSISEETLYVHKKYEPYVEQVEAALAALENGRGIIVGPTGVGKSTICELVCDAFRVPTLIVVPKLELKRQLTESLTEAFGIGMVGPLGKNSEPRYPISVENVDALDPKRKLKGIDCVIIDEFHHSAAATYRELNLKAWTDIYFKIGLTATPFRANDEERLLLESVLSKVIYRIEYKTAVDKGYIVPLEAYYVDLPKAPAQEKGKKGERKKVKDVSNFHAAYSHFVVKNDYRNDLIAQMTANLMEAGYPTLVLTKQVAHGLALQQRLEALGHAVPFAEGANELKSDFIASFNRGDTLGLIGTTGVLGEGVDTKRAEWVILAGGGKSKNQFMQNCGRVFRRFDGKVSGKVILFRDPNNKWLLEHFNQCVKYLAEEYGIVPAKLEF